MKDFLHLINIEVDDVYAEMLFQVIVSPKWAPGKSLHANILITNY